MLCVRVGVVRHHPAWVSGGGGYALSTLAAHVPPNNQCTHVLSCSPCVLPQARRERLKDPNVRFDAFARTAGEHRSPHSVSVEACDALHAHELLIPDTCAWFRGWSHTSIRSKIATIRRRTRADAKIATFQTTLRSAALLGIPNLSGRRQVPLAYQHCHRVYQVYACRGKKLCPNLRLYQQDSNPPAPHL